MVKINLKWNKEKIPEFELEKEQQLIDLQSLIYSLTNVTVEKQKLIYKGSMLKTDNDLIKLQQEKVVQIMLMGQAENQNKSIKEPENKTVFIEDLSKEELIKIMKQKKQETIVPIGLKNLGNTCYFNSVIQCLKRIDEVKESLQEHMNGYQSNILDQQVTKSLARLFNQLENKAETIIPYDFIDKFSMAFPHLAEPSQNGGFKQQDADESFQSILQVLENNLQAKDLEGNTIQLIKKLFEIELETNFKNTELTQEEPTITYETTKKLSCIIDNQGEPVDTLLQGIEVGLVGNIEKISEIDHQNHIYQKKSTIKKLPSYLVCQMVRFFWKDKSEIAGTEATKAKILRNISFPIILDIFNLCSSNLQTQLQYGRDLEKKKLEDQKQNLQDKFELYKKEQLQKKKVENGMEVEVESKDLFKKFKDQQKESEIQEHDNRLYRQHGLGLETGNFELIGVLTHKGRTADSGHYVAWIHQKGGNINKYDKFEDQWAKFDDDVVTLVKTEEVLALRGGGDWHMAYYCIYRKLEVD